MLSDARLGQPPLRVVRPDDVGATVRILFVVLVCVAFALPLLWSVSLPGGRFVLRLAVLLIVSGAVILHYLFPLRFGIRCVSPGRTLERRETLTDHIELHRVVFDVPLSGSCSSIRALVVSDLHCNSQGRLELIADAFSGLAGRGYDLVFVLGDLGEKRALIPSVLASVASLDPKHGTFLVRSNHDCECGREDVILEEAGKLPITVLSNAESAVPALGLSIVGLEYPWRRGALPDRTDGAFAIGLTHTPDNITHFSRIGVPFVLAGHTHGGSFRLPLIGPLLVPSRFGRLLDRGWFELAGTFMHVTPGIGYFPGLMGRKGTLLEVTIQDSAPSAGERRQENVSGTPLGTVGRLL